MKTILLAGYESTSSQQSRNLIRTSTGRLWIDEQISRLRNGPGYEVVVVIGGSDSEDVLRDSRELEHCELVFDTNGFESTPLTNLRSGLHVTADWALVLDIAVPCPTRSEWQRLLSLMYREDEPFHLARLDHRSALLVTRQGNQFIKNNKDLTGIEDSRLNVRYPDPHEVLEQVADFPAIRVRFQPE